MNLRNTTKMVEHKLVFFATVRALWSLVTLLIKLIRTLLKRKYIQDQNYAILAYMLWERRYSFVPVTGLECSYGKIFIPVTEISIAKTEVSVTGPAGLSNEHIDIFTKKRVARRDLGNQASPVDRAYMKRPWIWDTAVINFRTYMFRHAFPISKVSLLLDVNNDSSLLIE